jgi:hypothetical protein
LEIAKLILEYLKVILSAPVLLSIVGFIFILIFKEDIKALLLRVAKIKFPGGAEVSTPQSDRQSDEASENRPEPQPDINISGLPTDLSPTHRQTVEQIIRAERATSYLWEYRFLNYFLVYNTQRVLDWLIDLNQLTTYSHYDATWLPIIPAASERNAIINALESHHLIQIVNGLIEVTPKGREYQQWRGALPPLT